MKKSKVGKDSDAEAQAKGERAQLGLRMEQELRAYFDELGARCGRTAQQFVIEAIESFGDVLVDALLAQDRDIEEAKQRHRNQLREKIQSSRR